MQTLTGYLFRCTPEQLGATLAAIRSGQPAGTDPERETIAEIAEQYPGLLPLLDELEQKKYTLRLQKWSRKRKPKPQPDSGGAGDQIQGEQ